MKPPAIRLALCAALFVLWLAYLGYQVLNLPVANGRQLVLSRPQILAAEMVVIAELPAPTSEAEGVTVTVSEVLRGEGVKEGDKIQVTNLAECRPVRRGDGPPLPDWAGAGPYLLPLRSIHNQPGHYEVAPVPASPGFEMPNLVRIYPATDEARAQYERIKERGDKK